MTVSSRLRQIPRSQTVTAPVQRRWRTCRGLILITLACLSQSLLAQSFDDLFPDPVIARGNGVLVRKGDLERAFIAYQSNLAAKGKRISEVERPLREAQLLDRLIVTQLLVNRTTDEDRANARTIAAKNLAASKEQSPSDAMFERRLKTLGLTVAQYNLQIMEFSLAQAVLERSLGAQVTVTDQQIDDFYNDGTDILVTRLSEQLTQLAADPNATGNQLKALKDRMALIRRTNLGRFNKLEQRRIRHLLLATVDKNTQKRIPDEEIEGKRRKIEQLLAIAKAGEDFTKLIELYSEEDGAATSKGEATLVRKGRIPQLESAAFSLVPNQISDVVETVLGFHIVKLEEIIPAERVSREAAAPKIKEILTEQQLQTLMPAFFAALKKEADITIVSDRFKTSIPDDANPLETSELVVPSPSSFQ